MTWAKSKTASVEATQLANGFFSLIGFLYQLVLLTLVIPRFDLIPVKSLYFIPQHDFTVIILSVTFCHFILDHVKKPVDFIRVVLGCHWVVLQITYHSEMHYSLEEPESDHLLIVELNVFCLSVHCERQHMWGKNDFGHCVSDYCISVLM